MNMKTFAFCAFGVIVLLFWLALRIIGMVDFKVGCGGHMKRAADANSVELAIQEMRTVVNYAEKKGLTSGYTSFFSFYQAPEKDIGFWYKNMKTSLEELESVKPGATSLEKSNILIKLRETLLDNGKDGDSLTVPSGISIYPRNVSYLFMFVIGVIFFGVGVLFYEYY